MFLIALRDLQWRHRRFLVAVVGTAMVFALTLILGAIATSFDGEVNRTIAALNVDQWVVPEAANGPFTGISLLPATLKIEEGESSPLIIGFHPIYANKLIDTTVFGYTPGAIGEPPIQSGRLPEKEYEAVIDDSSGLATGAKFTLLKETFEVVGTTHGLSMNLGNADVFLRLADVQKLVFNGGLFATTIAVRGHANIVPSGFKIMSNADAVKDLRRPLRKAMNAISLSSIFLWIIAATIIGSIVYTASIERTRDFAVMKATGTSTTAVMGSVAVQSVLLALTAGFIGALLTAALVPVFPIPLRIEPSQYYLLSVVSVGVGILASVASVRRAVRIEPALAFGGP